MVNLATCPACAVLTPRHHVLSMTSVAHSILSNGALARVHILAGDVDPTDVLVGAFFLILLLGLGFVALVQVKKWMRRDDEPDNGIGFTLGDIRRLHDEGRMTDEEYEKARTQMIAATQRAAERAAQAAKEAALKGAGVTDVDQLRARAKRTKPVSPLFEDDDTANEWQILPPEEGPPKL